MSRYAMVGARSGELLTYQGRAIVHDDKQEMQWLFPNSRIVRVTSGDSLGPTMRLRDHPDMRSTRFPLRREDFPDAR